MNQASGEIDKGGIGGLKHDSGPSFAAQIQEGGGFAWRKDLPDNRHVLLRARNDLSSTVAKSVSEVSKKEDPPSFANEDQTLYKPTALEPDALSPTVQIKPSMPNPSPKTVPRLAKASPPKANRKRGIPHVYRDFSNVPDVAGFVRKKTGGVTQPFPEKLHEMLDEANQPAIVTWLPHGRAFLVKKPKVFTEQIMPKYFRQTKLTSFQRQLNLYGFRRITQGPDAGAYYHELFLRGRPHLCMRMQRQKVKGTGHKQPADAQTEPNFYIMPPSQLQQSPEPLHTTSSPPSTPTPMPKVYADMSPGLSGVHGAAHLLKTIAAGLPGSATNSPFSLGRQAVEVPASVGLIPSMHQPPPSSQAGQASLTPRTEQSLSLLGRVTQAENAPTTEAPSPFIWPPSRPYRIAPPSSNEAASPTPPQPGDTGKDETKEKPKEPGVPTSESVKEDLTVESGTKEETSTSPAANPPAEQSEKGEPTGAPIRGGGKEEDYNQTKVLEENSQFSAEGKAESQTDLDSQSGILPKTKGLLFSKATDLIENKVMRVIETEEA